MPTEVTPNFTVESDPGPNANSYSAIQFYKDYLANDPHKDISLQTDDEIAQSLINSTATLDTEYGDTQQYDGTLYDSTYALCWPREGVTDIRTDELIDEYTAFPAALQKATAVMAWYVQAGARYVEDSAPGQVPDGTVVGNIDEKELDGTGKIAYNYDYQIAVLDKTAGKLSQAGVIPDEVYGLISPLLLPKYRKQSGNGLKFFQMGRG